MECACSTYLVQNRFNRATMAKRTSSDIESELPQAKQVRLKQGTPRRSEGRARRKLQLQEVSPATFQVKDSPMGRAIKRSMTVLKFARAQQAGNQRVVRTPLKACTPIKLPPRKLMTYPIYFKTWKYVTNMALKLHALSPPSAAHVLLRLAIW